MLIALLSLRQTTIKGAMSTEYMFDEHATPQYDQNYILGITISHHEKGNGFDHKYFLLSLCMGKKT